MGLKGILKQNAMNIFPPSGDLSMGGYKLTNLGTPTASGDATNKAYVDAFVSGLFPVPASQVVTTAPLTATYNNGASGIGATLTLTATGVLVIDTRTILLNDVVVINNQVSTFQNGIYKCTTEGAIGVNAVFTRATYFNSASNIKEGTYTVIEDGTHSGQIWIETESGPFIVGTTPIGFSYFGIAVGGVTSVFGRDGAVISTNGDYTASQVTNVPAGSISATDVQGAINELAGDISGLGTMAFQDADDVDITGGTIDNTPITNSSLSGLTFALEIGPTPAIAIAPVLNWGPSTGYGGLVDLASFSEYQALTNGDPATDVVSWNALFATYSFAINYTADLAPGGYLRFTNNNLVGEQRFAFLNTPMINYGFLQYTTPSGDLYAPGTAPVPPVTDDLLQYDGTNFVPTAVSAVFGTQVIGEIPSGAVDGMNVTFTLAHTPIANTDAGYIAGARQWNNVSGDYTISTNIITTAIAPIAGPILFDYKY